LPNCQILSCDDNQLTTLSNLPNCQELWCSDNQLLFNTLNDFKKLWKFKKFYVEVKYIKKWRSFKLKSIINKKRDLNLELLYSPNLNFYKLDPYYKHFIDHQNNK
jgi:hypothetical protein